MNSSNLSCWKTFMLLIIMGAGVIWTKVERVRVGVTLYPSYVEPCVLKETNLFKVKCKDPGLSVKVLEVLQYALRSKFYFDLIPIKEVVGKGSWLLCIEAFERGEIDMSIDLWTSNSARIKQASLSVGTIYKRRSFLISSKTVQVSSDQMNFIPLTLRVIASIFGAAGCLSVLVGLLHVVRTMSPTESLKIRVFAFLDQTRTTMWKLCMVLLKQPVGLKKWDKGAGTTMILFSWFFASVILAGMYDAVITTELLPRLSMPFSDSMGLAEQLKSGQRQMIVEDPTAPFFSVLQTAETPHYLALREALKTNPVKVVGSQEVIPMLKEGSNYVYAANTVAAKFIMKQDCDLLEIPDDLAEFSGLHLAFPLNSTLAYEFREVILQLQSTIHRIVNEAGSNRCLESGVTVKPLPLSYLTMVFVTAACGLGIALMMFILELGWCKKQMDKNEFLSTVREAVLMEDQPHQQHQTNPIKKPVKRQIEKEPKSMGMYSNFIDD